jgi:hypothetical protein
MRIISSRLVQLAACAAFVAYSAPLGAAAPSTVKGEVVDQACYTKDKANVGEKHKDCGLSCAKKGGKLSLVTADGSVYQITGAYTANKNAKLLEANLFGVPVEATGEVTEKDGAKQIDVSALKKAS